MMKPDSENVTPEMLKTETAGSETASGTSPLKVWVEPVVTELEISRTAHSPSLGSDGGVADCQHI